MEKLTRFAGRVARRWKWREAADGRMPRGNDPETIVQEVVLAVWAGKSRLQAGYTEEEFEREFKRQICRKTSHSNELKENWELKSEWDYLPRGEDGKPRSAFEGMVAEMLSPDEELMAKEKEEGKAEFEKLLEAEPELLAVWRCWQSGVEKREEIAERLGISVEEVTNRQKRLARRAAEFEKRLKAKF